jgi:uncharacterized protein
MRGKIALRSLFVILLLGVPSGSSFAEQVNLSWMAGTVGGGWYTIAAGISTVIQEADPELIIKVLPGGGAQNPTALNEKKVDMAFGLPFLNKAAVEGQIPYETKHSNLRLIACGYMIRNHLHLFAGTDTPYKTMDDVFGGSTKPRIAMSHPGASEIYVLERILEVYKTNIDGLAAKGYHIARGNYAYQVSQFRDRNIDIVWAWYAAPAAAVTEAAAGRNLRIIPFSDKVIKHLDQYGLEPCDIPAGTYPQVENGKETVQVCCNGSAIMVHKDMQDAVAYRLAKAINENVERLHKVHPSLTVYEPQNGLLGSPGVIPHPGALKYYKEKGWAK